MISPTITRLIALITLFGQMVVAVIGISAAGTTIALAVQKWRFKIARFITWPWILTIAVGCFSISFFVNSRTVSQITYVTVIGLVVLEALVEANKHFFRPLMKTIVAISDVVEAQLTHNHETSLLDKIDHIDAEDREIKAIIECLVDGHKSIKENMTRIEERLTAVEVAVCSHPIGCQLIPPKPS